MKKVLFGIFAHPDDEAFGPAGTLLKEVASGTELHLITLTLGEAGSNPDNVANLVDVREKEWRDAGNKLGATSMHCLGYRDGLLSNTSMIDIGAVLVDYIHGCIEHCEPDVEIELMSIDLNGVTGHIDHIVAARAACWAFYTLKKSDARFKRIRLICQPRHRVAEVSTQWLFVEPGRSEDEIDQIIDAREYREQIISVMRAHHSQRADCERHIRSLGDDIGLNYFKILK